VPGTACLGYPDALALAVTVALPVSIPVTVAVAVPLTVAFDKLQQCVPESLRGGQYVAEPAPVSGQRQRRTRPDELAVAIGIRIAVRNAQGHDQRHDQRHHHELDSGDARRSRRRQLELGPEPGHQRQRQ
jgi:hypothetical protein